MPPSRTIIEPPLKEAKFEVITQFAKDAVLQKAAVRLVLPSAVLLPTATAPPQEAEFEVMVQSVAVTVESPSMQIAPPPEAEFEAIVQFAAVTVESAYVTRRV